MKLINEKTGETYRMTKTKRPKMSQHRGRTWDRDSIIINGESQDVWRDFTWGSCNYINLDGGWYRFSIDATDFAGVGGTFTLS